MPKITTSITWQYIWIDTTAVVTLPQHTYTWMQMGFLWEDDVFVKCDNIILIYIPTVHDSATTSEIILLSQLFFEYILIDNVNYWND